MFLKNITHAQQHPLLKQVSIGKQDLDIVQAKLHFFEREYMYDMLHCNEHLQID